MSSSGSGPLSGIRRVITATTRFKALADAISAVKAKQADIEKTDFVVLNQISDSALGFKDNLNYRRSYTRYDSFLCPIEPDVDRLRMWLPLSERGNYAIDKSCNKRNLQMIEGGHSAQIVGIPRLIQGIDTGIGGSVAMRFNGIDTSVIVGDFENIRISGNLFGFTITMRVKPESFALDSDTGGGPVIYGKVDDGSNGQYIAFYPNGDLVYHVKFRGTSYNSLRASVFDVSKINRWYELGFSFNPQAPAIPTIYVDNVASTVNDTVHGSDNYFPQDTDGHIARGKTEVDNRYTGGIQDFKIYGSNVTGKPGALTVAEMTNLFANKWSISNIPFGRVAICGHSWAATPSGGFTSEGFTSAGFT